jgi:gas vesicle protein GvpL/GvpF
MAVLPYCILLAKYLVEIPLKGICNSEIQRLAEGSLLALYSHLEKNEISAQNFRQAAVEFHDVVHAVFNHVAVVQFRFPTWLSEPEVAEHLREESVRYQDFLTHHADHVQMEIRIALLTDEASQSASSGTEHLRQRATQLRELHGRKEKMKQLLSSEVIEWRERELPTGLRVYALVERDRIAGFREKLSGQDTTLSHSGPWPAMEFLNSGGRFGN